MCCFHWLPESWHVGDIRDIYKWLLVFVQGKNHFRRFRLTADLTRLTWESSRRSDAAVLISQITELKTGQTTPTFKRNPLPEFEVRHNWAVYHTSVLLALIRMHVYNLFVVVVVL